MGWRDEYLASIKAADEADPTTSLLIAACSVLQDQVGALQAENDLLRSGVGSGAQAQAPGQPQGPRPGSGSFTPRAVHDGSAEGPGTPTAAQTAQLRVDLAEALRSQGKAQTRLKAVEAEAEALRQKTRADGLTIRNLTAERSALALKVRDRDEELRGKAKLLDDVQDEVIALNLQLNVAEQQRDKVKRENKDLVDRWMKRMGQEAEAMNASNEPYIKRGR